MTSTFSGLELGKRSLGAHEQALQTTGHNLSNASTEGYSRQRVEFAEMDPVFMPGLNREDRPGQLGQGTVVSRIERIRDELLDRRIVAQAGGEGYWKTRDPYIRQLDQMYLEVGDNSLRAKMDAFWDGWQELSRHPADSAPRTALLERARTLVDGIHDRFQGLKGLQDMADEDIMLTVERVNELSRQIAGLNNDIQKIIAQGDRPNDLFDRRDLLVDKLSSIIEITADRRDSDEFMLHTGGIVLVQGGIGRQFEITRGIDTEGYGRISWADTGDIFEPTRGRGSLSALLELRDDTIERELRTLDNLAMNFVDLVNENHRAAYGINGRTGLDFFTEHHFVTNVDGNYDRDGDGEYDSTYIYRVNGANTLDERAQVGLEGTITLSAFDPAGAGGQTLTQIPYYAEDTVADIVSRINNSGADVTARLNREGRLSLRGTVTESRGDPDFVIRHIEDSGRFLEGYAGLLQASGPLGAFDWGAEGAAAAFRGGEYSTAPVAHPSGWIEVNPLLLRETASVASGYGENGRQANPGNGDAALAIAAIRNTVVMVGRLGTFDDYFADSVGRIGLLGEQSGRALETQSQIMKQLNDMRQSVSGVNMDEELANMIKYQHGYQAVARFVTTVNSMLDILMRLGA
ncbi:MAG: flagellar hook-associated protein FlgK [Spirochaetaceae bacterium]|jgi:flagellar hook-associated protein 1 FlgK|nr:flagellar hook-associated protein FlgK [Spirochaetaceae bacterium]